MCPIYLHCAIHSNLGQMCACMVVVPGAECSKPSYLCLCTATERSRINAYRSAFKCLPSNPSRCYLFCSTLGGILSQSAFFSLRSFDISCFIIIVLLPLEVLQCAHDTQCMPNTSRSLRNMFCFHAVLFSSPSKRAY